MSGFGNNSNRQSSNRHGSRQSTGSRLPSGQAGASHGGTLGAFDCGGGAPRQSVFSQNAPPSGSFPRSSARSQAFPPGASGQWVGAGGTFAELFGGFQPYGAGSSAVLSGNGGTMQRQGAGGGAVQSHNEGTMQRYGASHGAAQIGGQSARLPVAGRTTVHYTDHVFIRGVGWIYSICRCQNPASHKDAFFDPEGDLVRQFRRDLNETPLLKDRINELAPAAAGKTIMNRDEFLAILPQIVNETTLKLYRAKLETEKLIQSLPSFPEHMSSLEWSPVGIIRR
jgi:hypothetical protein